MMLDFLLWPGWLWQDGWEAGFICGFLAMAAIALLPIIKVEFSRSTNHWPYIVSLGYVLWVCIILILLLFSPIVTLVTILTAWLLSKSFIRTKDYAVNTDLNLTIDQGYKFLGDALAEDSAWLSNFEILTPSNVMDYHTVGYARAVRIIDQLEWSGKIRRSMDKDTWLVLVSD